MIVHSLRLFCDLRICDTLPLSDVDGKTVLRKGKRERFYERQPSYKMKKQELYKMRNQRRLAIERAASEL